MKIILFAALLLTLFSCENKKNTHKAPELHASVDTILQESQLVANEIESQPVDEITLTSSDLDIIVSLTKDERADYEYFETGQPLKGYLKFELIDQALFYEKKNTSVNYLLADTTEIKKKNGVITLKCRKKNVTYTDIPSDGDTSQEYGYVGQIEFLDQYLIAGSYWESLDYKLIDKISGEETLILGEYPFISADKKHIICIFTNPYDLTADLELYSITGKQIKHVMSASFKNWMPTVEPQKMFWSTDGYFYAAVNHVGVFWTEDGNLNDKRQYIRIQVL